MLSICYLNCFHKTDPKVKILLNHQFKIKFRILNHSNVLLKFGNENVQLNRKCFIHLLTTCLISIFVPILYFDFYIIDDVGVQVNEHIFTEIASSVTVCFA